MSIPVFYWKVTAAPPAVARHCARCEPACFKSSGKFRINAQQRHLDVWLVYRCTQCGASWNLPLYSRISPHELAPRLYHRLLSNCPALAAEYAGNTSILQKAGAQPLPAEEFTVEGPPLPAGRPIELSIECTLPAGCRLDKILSLKTGLSRSRVQSMFRSGAFRCDKIKGPSHHLKGHILLSATLPNENS